MTGAATKEQQLPREWRGRLKPGERILWQGAPHGAFYWRRHYLGPIVGAGAGMAAVFWLELAGPWVLAVMAALALSAVYAPVADAYKMRHSFFTLTNRRAFIGTDTKIFGRKLESYPLGPDTELSLAYGDELHAVHFAHVMRPTRHGKERIDIGFQNLTYAEASKVHDLIQEIKETPR